MKIHIDKKQILYSLSFAQGISEQNNISSYYSLFMLEAKNDSLIIRSADRERTFQQIINSKEEQLAIFNTGAVLLPVSKVYNILYNFPDGLICLELQDNSIVITPVDNPNSITHSVPFRSIDEYPENLHRDLPDTAHQVNAQEFYKIINSVAFAASSDYRSTSLFLAGLFFEIKDNFLIAVATDRSRMSVSKTPVNFSISNTQENKDIIVPLKTIFFIKKLIYKREGDISLFFDEDKLFFEIEDIVFSTSLISGKYYDYSRIIPDKTRNIVSVKKEVLKRALDRVSLSGDNKKDTPVRIQVEKEKMLLSSGNKESGEGREEIPIELKGNPHSFAVKAQYLLDPLDVILSDDVEIDFGEKKQELLKITSPEDENTLHIAVPFNL